jgi:hypothetical protein
VVSEREQLFSKKLIVAKPCGFELCLGLIEHLLSNQRVGKTPWDLRILRIVDLPGSGLRT